MAEVHPDPSTFGQPVVAPEAAPAPAVPAVAPAADIQQVEAQVEAVAQEVAQLAQEAPAPAPEAPVPALEPAPTPAVVAPRYLDAGRHLLSGLGQSVTLPPIKR